MYQSSALTPSGSRSSTPAVAAAPAGVTRSPPSAPTPRRRSHKAATREGDSATLASMSGSSTKSFWVPWPLAKITRSGYVPPCPQCVLDESARPGVEPMHPVIPPEPGPLPSHIAAGTDIGLLPRVPQLVGFRTGVQCRDHLGVAQRA